MGADVVAQRLFTVTVEAEIVVVAASEREAEDWVIHNRREIDSGEFFASASVMRCMPVDWDRETTPYGGERDRTLGEWIDDGAAPDFRALEGLRNARGPSHG